MYAVTQLLGLLDRYSKWMMHKRIDCVLLRIALWSTGGGHLYFRLYINLVKGLSKHTLNTYFLCMKIDPKVCVFACVFLNLSIMPFSKFVNMTKNTPCFPILYIFCTPKQCTCVHCLILKNNRNYVNFLWGWYPTSNTSAPPPRLWSWCFRIHEGHAGLIHFLAWWNFTVYFSLNFKTMRSINTYHKQQQNYLVLHLRMN